MKKVIVLFVLALYASASMGATIHVHFCMDKFAGFALSNTIQEKCPKCGMEEGGCCKDESTSFQVSKDQLKAYVGFNQILFSKLVWLPKQSMVWHLYQSIKHASIQYVDPPPLLTRNQLQAYYCTYLI